jgi:hypothetical protein
MSGMTALIAMHAEPSIQTAYSNFFVQVKGKAFLLQAWTGPWGSRRLRLQNF